MSTNNWSASFLVGIPLNERIKHCPPFLQKIVSQAIGHLKVEKIWIFGSRSRKDHQPKSDYDLAFLLPQTQNDPNTQDTHSRNQIWSAFSVDIMENAETLFPLDLLDFDKTHKEIQSEIIKNGILLYEKASK